MNIAAALLVLLALATGCSSVSARKVVPLDRYRHFYVEQPVNENHHLDELIATELRRRGYDASSGPRTMMPENTEVVVTYTDRWAWDFKTYLMELNLELYTARSNKKLADGRCYQPSMKTRSPEDAIREILGRWFAK